MGDVELALAASARPWAGALHRFLADHGGARVRAIVMGPEEAVAETYDALIIDDVCSFLTPRLVDQVRRHGRLVVGVYDARDGADAKRRLLECGVDDVIEAEAGPDEFLGVVRAVLDLAPYAPAPAAATPPERKGEVIVVGAPPGGCGASEVALALAGTFGALLVDADDVAPSLAQRLGTPLLPNLRTAIDVVYHQSGSLDEVIVDTGVPLLPGLATGEDWGQLHPGEVDAVVTEAAAVHSRVVVNVGSGLERPHVGEGRFGLARAMVRMADRIVGVGLGHPIGLARLVRWASEAAALAPDTPLVLAINRAARSPYQRAEIENELADALPGLPVVFLPEDKRVAEAAWAGVPVSRGPFRRAVGRLAAEVVV